MTEFVRGFVIPDVAQVHRLYREAINAAQALAVAERAAGVAAGAGRRKLTALTSSYRDFQSDLNRVAQQAAVQAMKEMREKLAATQVRTATPQGPHLRDLLIARPLDLGTATGAVGVADVTVLERAINPYSPNYGTYWRAQEYGTGEDGVPSQLGRVIHGYFLGGPGPERPNADYAGGGGPHPVFVSDSSSTSLFGRGPRGGFGGYGTIGAEIQGRHFIRDGADGAAVAWRRAIAQTQQRAIDSLAVAL